MSYTDLLIDVCDVTRFSEGPQDAYGKPSKTWPVHLDDTPCRLSRAKRTGLGGSGVEVKIGAEVVIAPYTLFVGDIDIVEQDRVVLNGVTYEVLMVEPRQDAFGSHHKECLVRTVR